jgi:hypothetical protein
MHISLISYVSLLFVKKTKPLKNGQNKKTLKHEKITQIVLMVLGFGFWVFFVLVLAFGSSFYIR